MGEPTPIQKFPMNPKRRNNYWEPVYKPERASSQFCVFDWNLENSHGPKQAVCSAEVLKTIVKADERPTHSIKKATFSICDFEGSFNFCRISFTECVFEDCDFGRSEWHNAKFSNCTFKNCSFSTSRFSEVQFIKCKWVNIGISAEEMFISKVLISNPYEFIQSAYTNVDKNVLSQKNTDPEYQLYRLEKTKSKVARMVLISAQASADDDAFYNAVMAHTDQISAWKATEALHIARRKKNLCRFFWYPVWILYCLERFILRASGLINGWGGRVGRAALFGIALIISFSFLYWYMEAQPDYKTALLSSFEITLLVGYTKYTTGSTDFCLQILFAINMLLGLWWYTIFVPTVINRLSRLKQ